MNDHTPLMPPAALSTPHGISDSTEPVGREGNHIDLTASSREKIAKMDGHFSGYASSSAVSVSSVSRNDPVSHQYGPARAQPSPATSVNSHTGAVGEALMRPYPYFYYKDFSRVRDPDPLTPLTAPGRVPNFPAKMHSILSREDLSDIVAWMPHGRSWRVLKPREFEIRVIPTYFEHSKFSSFIRQANGWGFRRITQGKDRNSYYHEMFLRGLPHLCKMMKRPGVSEKQAADADQEPDFDKIADENPVPEKTEDTSILLQCTLQGGPKARMPIFFGTLSSGITPSVSGGATIPGTMPATVSASQPPLGFESSHMRQQQQQFGTSASHLYHATQPNQYPGITKQNEGQNNGFGPVDMKLPPQTNVGPSSTHQITSGPNHLPQQVSSMTMPSSFVPNPMPLPTNSIDYNSIQQPHQFEPAHGLSATSFCSTSGSSSQIDPSDPASQFAAGFAAATALSQQQLRAFFGQALASVQNPPNQNLLNNFGGVPAPVPVPHSQQAPQPQHGFQQPVQVHQPRQQQQLLHPLPAPRLPHQQQQQQPHIQQPDPQHHQHHHDCHSNHQHQTQPTSAFPSNRQPSNIVTAHDECQTSADVWTVG